MEHFKRCGNCASFGSERDLLPTGFCASGAGRMVREGDEACVKWEQDFRGLGPGGSEPVGGESAISRGSRGSAVGEKEKEVKG